MTEPSFVLAAFIVFVLAVILCTLPWPPKRYRITQDGFGKYHVEGKYGLRWLTVSLWTPIHWRATRPARFETLDEARHCVHGLMLDDVARRVKPKFIERG